MSAAQRGKPYVEAFPMVSLNAARRAWGKGQRFIEWSNEEGVVVGHVEVLDISDTAFRFQHRFFGTPNVEKTGGSNELGVCSRAVNPQRIAREIVCPRKQCNVDKVYFVRGEWACRGCHDLSHLVKRFSPAHKTIMARDALSAKINSVPPEQRCTRDYHNDRRKLERMQRETANLPHIPRELLFRTEERWLEPGELPKSFIGPDEKGYGWVPGERRGLKAFVTPEPPAPLPRLWLTQLSSTLPLLGLRLFRGNLTSVLAEHASEGVTDVERALHAGDLCSDELAAAIAEAMAIQKLELAGGDLSIQDRLDGEGLLQIYTRLAYYGGSRLLRVKARGSTVSPLLRAMFNETHITFATSPPDTEWAKAEQVVRLGVRRLEQQLLAQGAVLDRYHADLPAYADGLAAVLLSNRARGKLPGGVRISFRK